MVQGVTKPSKALEIPCGASLGWVSLPSPSHAQIVMGGLLCPLLHPPYSSCSPKSKLGSADTGLASFSLKCCFFITSKFCRQLCKCFS